MKMQVKKPQRVCEQEILRR